MSVFPEKLQWSIRYSIASAMVWMFACGCVHAATSADATIKRIESLTRTELLQFACEKIGVRDVLEHQQQMLELLKQGRPSDPVIQHEMALQLFLGARLTYNDAAVVLSVLARTRAQYDRSLLGNEALQAFVSLFPLAVSDDEIKQIAAQASWTPSPAEWALAFWATDHHRKLGTTGRRVQYWGGGSAK
jgi:hypothetical protein